MPLSDLFRVSRTPKIDPFESLREAASGIKEAALYVGQHTPNWAADWAEIDDVVEQTMEVFPDRLEMRLHAFAQTFVIDKTWQDYTGTGFAGKLSEILEDGPRVHYVTSWVWPKGQVFPLHHHLWPEQHIVLSGYIVYSIDGRERRLSPGRSSLIRSGAIHGAKALEDSRVLVIITRDHSLSPPR